MQRREKRAEKVPLLGISSAGNKIRAEQNIDMVIITIMDQIRNQQGILGEVFANQRSDDTVKVVVNIDLDKAIVSTLRNLAQATKRSEKCFRTNSKPNVVPRRQKAGKKKREGFVEKKSVNRPLKVRINCKRPNEVIIIRKSRGQPLAEVLSIRCWQRIGAVLVGKLGLLVKTVKSCCHIQPADIQPLEIRQICHRYPQHSIRNFVSYSIASRIYTYAGT